MPLPQPHRPHLLNTTRFRSLVDSIFQSDETCYPLELEPEALLVLQSAAEEYIVRMFAGALDIVKHQLPNLGQQDMSGQEEEGQEQARDQYVDKNKEEEEDKHEDKKEEEEEQEEPLLSPEHIQEWVSQVDDKRERPPPLILKDSDDVIADSDKGPVLLDENSDMAAFVALLENRGNNKDRNIWYRTNRYWNQSLQQLLVERPMLMSARDHLGRTLLHIAMIYIKGNLFSPINMSGFY